MRGRSVEVLAIPNPWPPAPAVRIISGYHGEGGPQQAFTARRGSIEHAAEKMAARAMPGRHTVQNP
jgi:hypothetical protein